MYKRPTVYFEFGEYFSTRTRDLCHARLPGKTVFGGRSVNEGSLPIAASAQVVGVLLIFRCPLRVIIFAVHTGDVRNADAFGTFRLAR